ncbi:hypothetical protein LVJ82_05455 [Vitreoscilla massiliensis]|uniref:Uncharacterized protein n=1 Tax=Vitreoscilla massiliensis TaxID=1689272 RepID=A0ABY4E4W2_9NEIS|nr:hypothetical protein [Vitreoscilla massiliensis]UOO90425.1 hypothetical protein LVJ82_05455 [Vitreoscilla massiliensis]
MVRSHALTALFTLLLGVSNLAHADDDQGTDIIAYPSYAEFKQHYQMELDAWYNSSEQIAQAPTVLNRHWQCVHVQAMVKTLSQHPFYAQEFQQDMGADMATTLALWQRTETTMHAECARVKQQFDAL